MTAYYHHTEEGKSPEQIWTNAGDGSHFAFDRLGKYYTKFVDRKYVELWDVSSFAVPMAVLSFPDYCIGKMDCLLSWSFDAFTIVGAFVSTRKNSAVKRYIFVWDVRSLQLVHQFRIPFGISTICPLPSRAVPSGESTDVRFLVGTADHDGHYLVDCRSGTVGEVSIECGEEKGVALLVAETFTLMAASAALSVTAGTPDDTCSGDGTSADVESDRTEPTDCDPLSVHWRGRLGSTGGSAKRTSTSAMLATDSRASGSGGICTVYMVLNREGCAATLLQVEVRDDEEEEERGQLSFSVRSSLPLGGYTGRAHSISLSADGSLLVLGATHCAAVHVYSTGGGSQLALHSTYLRSGPLAAEFAGAGFLHGVERGGVLAVAVQQGTFVAGGAHRELAGSVANKLVMAAVHPNDASGASDSEPDIHSYSVLPLPRTGVSQLAFRPCYSPWPPRHRSPMLARPLLLCAVDRSRRQCFALSQWVGSDFPGPMYPVGYRLVLGSVSFVEAEDALDRAVMASGARRSSSTAAAVAAEETCVGTAGETVRGGGGGAAAGCGGQIRLFSHDAYLQRLPLDLPTSHRAVSTTGTDHVKIKSSVGRSVPAADSGPAGPTGSRSARPRSRKRKRGGARVRRHIANGDGVDSGVRGGGGDDGGDDGGGGGGDDGGGGPSGEQPGPEEEVRESVGGDALEQSSDNSDHSDEDHEGEGVGGADRGMSSQRSSPPPTIGYYCNDPADSAIAGSGGVAAGAMQWLLSDVLPVPQRIRTGDYAAKLARDRELAAATDGLCRDRGAVAASLRRLQGEAVERAVAQEEKRERDRQRGEERRNQKLRLQREEQDARLRQQYLLFQQQQQQQQQRIAMAAMNPNGVHPSPNLPPPVGEEEEEEEEEQQQGSVVHSLQQQFRERSAQFVGEFTAKHSDAALVSASVSATDGETRGETVVSPPPAPPGTADVVAKSAAAAAELGIAEMHVE